MSRINCILLCALAVPMWGQNLVISADGKQMRFSAAASREWTGPTPRPIKCGALEHIEYWPECERGYSCLTDKPDHVITHSRCVENTHEVTEREWQELNKRLKMLHSEVVCATSTNPRCGRTDAWDRKMEKGIK